MADDKPAKDEEKSKPQTSRPHYRFVGHVRPSEGTQRIAGPWGSVERGGPAVRIPADALKHLESVGFQFEREEVND